MPKLEDVRIGASLSGECVYIGTLSKRYGEKNGTVRWNDGKVDRSSDFWNALISMIPENQSRAEFDIDSTKGSEHLKHRITIERIEEGEKADSNGKSKKL